MAGGKGNIKPEDGKQFSKDYQPPEKWTEERALKLGRDLIEWLKVEDNIFVKRFLIIENNYYEELIAYLCKKFSSFLNTIQRAKEIQKCKLIELGVRDELNSNMTKFTLVNLHHMSDKVENINKNINTELPVDYSNLSDEELEQLLAIQEKLGGKDE